MITVSHAMMTQIEPVLFSRTIGEVLQLLADSRLPGLPVVNNNSRLIGVVFKDSLLGEIPPLTPLVK